MAYVYAPEGRTDVHELALSPLPPLGPDLQIAILQNNKPNAALLLSTAASALADRLGAPPIIVTEKERASLPAPDDLYERLAAEASLVFVGSAD
jgi:hypothetical protein